MATDRRILVAVLLAAAVGGCGEGRASAGPTGWDVYRRIDLLPLLRAGEQARLFSSYDRRGGNDDGASGRSSCLRLAGGRCVIAEHSGPGEIDSIWTTRPRAGDVRRTGTIRIELDGRAVLNRALTTVVSGRLGRPWSFPAVADARDASGAVWIKVPMVFRSRMVVSTSHNPRYYHVNYRTFDDAGGLTGFEPAAPVANLRSPPAPDPPVDDAAGRDALTVNGPGTIRSLRVTLAHRPGKATLRSAHVWMSFDGRRTVDAPLGELFGSGLPGRVDSLLASQDRSGVLNAWWPMPFTTNATITVRGAPGSLVEAQVSRDPTVTDALARGEAGYFHATSRSGRTVRGRPWRVVEASGPGLLVGLSATLAGPRSQRLLEGDERIVTDGRTLNGTGTEDFFEGGFYWHYGPRTLPLVGSPAHLVRRGGCREDCRSMYRWLVADAVPFTRSLRFTLEHGDRNRLAGTYSTTALWYAR